MGKKIERWIDLSELPKRGKKQIDWTKSINYNIKGVYDNIKFVLTIIDYIEECKMVVIKYNNKTIDISRSHLKECKLGKLFNSHNGEFKIDIGYCFKSDKRNLTITDRKYIQDKSGVRRKFYRYTCNKCGWEDGWTVESSLLGGSGCRQCRILPNQTVTKGINDIPTTAPWMVKYFQGGYDEAKKYTRTSSRKVNFICPDCGQIKDNAICISKLYINKSIGCSCKGTYMSYPEKFIYSILKQLDIDFQTQYSPNYLGLRKSDFYIPSLKLVIETNGAIALRIVNVTNGDILLPEVTWNIKSMKI